MDIFHRVLGVYQYTNFWFAFNYNAGTDTLSAVAFDLGKQASVITNNQIKLNEWCLLTIVYDGTFTDSSTSVQNAGRIKIYINKTAQTLSFVGVIPSTSPSSLIDYPFELASDGYRNKAGNRELSNAKIWSEPLTSSEVETLYNYGSPIQTLANIPQSSNLKAWYKLDATEIYNSTSTEWEVSDATATIKNTILDPKNSSPRPYYEENNGGNLLPLTGTAGQSITISFWYYASGNADNIMFSRIENSAYWFGKQSTNNLRFLFTSNSGWTLGPSVPRDQWNHIVLTVTESGTSVGRTVKFYVNGGSPTTVTDSSSNLANWSGLSQKNTFGVGSYGSTNVDVLSSNYIYYNTALLDSEVANLYNSFSPDSENTPTVQPALSNFPKNSNITGWFKSDGLDSSGEGNNASSVGNILIGPAVSLRNGATIGMTQSNLVQSDLLTTSSYSPYALAFDGNDYIDCGNSADFSFGNGTTDSPFSTSFWFKLNSNSGIQPFLSKDNVTKEWTISIFGGGGIRIFLKNQGSNNQQSIDSTTTFSTGVWYHAVTTYDGRGGANAADGLSIYINGSLDTPTNVIKNSYTAMSSSSSDVTIGKYGGSYINGVMSNVSIWNTALTSSQVREIYNEGRPSNLHNFSGTAPVAWWQLGSNSSFNGNDWIVADEIGSSNGESDGMGVDALTNGVGATANGVSSGMSEGSLVGDAPYSTGNAVSSGMPVTARGTDVPATIYSITFDGVDQYMSFTNINNETLRYDFSISFWVKYNRYTAIPFGGSGTSWMRIMNATQQKLDINNGGSVWATGATNSLDQWHHYVIRRDANNLITTFVDGELYTNNAPTLAGRFLPTYLGAMKLNEFLEGKMTQVSMFDFALSESNVSAIYNNGMGYDISSLNPVNWWKMDEGSGTTVANHGSWSTNSGTLINGASWSTDTP